MHTKGISRSASHILVAATLAGLSLLPLSFLLSFEENLHCTQYTSFQIALFDMTPHLEEMPEPIIYKYPFAVPLRMYFGFGLLLFSFSPAVISTLFIYDKISAKKYFRSILYLIGLHGANLVLSIYFAGERFTALYLVAILYGCIMYPLFIAAALGWRNKLQGTAGQAG